MSNEELTVRIRNGEEELIPQLWQQVTRFITWKAVTFMRAFRGRGDVPKFEIHDLINESYFALLEAIDDFNYESTCSFLRFLDYRCRRAFQIVAGLNKRSDALFRAESGDIPLYDDGHDTSLLDTVPDPGETVEDTVTDSVYQQQLHDTLERALASLTTQQEILLRRRYYRGETQKEIASDLGYTPSTIEHREQSALRHLYNSRSLNGLNEFLETHTNYYADTGFSHFKNTGMSSVDTIAARREMLVRKWLNDHKGELNDAKGTKKIL